MTFPPPQAVVIGASAGAVEALSAILPALPGSFPLPIFVVVHLPPGRKSLLAEIFQARCHIRVREAEDKEPILAGTAYFAPPDYHLLIEQDRSLALSSDEPILYSRPSIDVLFESAAEAYGAGLVGIVLTGGNQDGAHGLKAIEEAGGLPIVQHPTEATAPNMPEAALSACPRARVLSLADIAMFLKDL
jgi:two-component system chemotaxis response regulator CheB